MQRIWIYQANRILSDDETQRLQVLLNEFAAQWKVHGKPLEASAEVRDNVFVIMKVNEDFAAASGCSIDSSVRFLKSIEEAFDITLFDRMQLAFQSGAGIQVADRLLFEKLIKEGTITDDTIVFDNSITTEADLSTRWAVPFKDSWHKRVFG